MGACFNRVAFEHESRRFPNDDKQRFILFEIGKTKERRAALALPQVLAGPAQAEVGASNFKAVGIFVNRLQAGSCHFRQGRRIQQDAVTFTSTTTDPTSKLVK